MIVKDAFLNDESYTFQNWRFNGINVGFSRMYYILDGEAYYEEDGKATRLKKGYLYLTPVKKPFSLYENPQDKLLHTYTHIYTFPEINEFTEIEVVEGTPLYDAVMLWRKYIHTQNNELVVTIVQFVLSCAIKRIVTNDNSVARMTKKCIDTLDDFSISTEEICRMVGYTREYITRSFTATYNMTPRQYLISRKMELALRSLEDGKLVKEVSDNYGYSSPYSFSKAFKRYYGMSPETYMKTFK